MFGNPPQGTDDRMGVVALTTLNLDKHCKARRSPMDPRKWNITVSAKEHPDLKPTPGLTVDTREILFTDARSEPPRTVAEAIALGFTTAYLVNGN